MRAYVPNEQGWICSLLHKVREDRVRFDIFFVFGVWTFLSFAHSVCESFLLMISSLLSFGLYLLFRPSP